MKLRVLTLSVVVLAGNSFPARAQQSPQPQSLSYTINLGPGWNAIASPLIVGSNTLNELFPAMPDGSILAKFNPATANYVQFTYDTIVKQWLTSAGAPGGTLNPGEGAFLNVPVALVRVISGVRATPHARLDAAFGPNLVGGQMLELARFEDLMGFAPQPGDMVFQYDRPLPNTPAPGQGASRTNRFGPNGWDVVPFIPA